jgi:hypothetical protein
MTPPKTVVFEHLCWSSIQREGRNAAFVKALDDVEVAVQALCAAAAFTSHHKIFITKGNAPARHSSRYFLKLTHQNSQNVKFILNFIKWT